METFQKGHEEQAWCLFAAAALSGLNASVRLLDPTQRVMQSAQMADQMLQQYRQRGEASKGA